MRRVGDGHDAQAGVSHASDAVPLAEPARRVAREKGRQALEPLRPRAEGAGVFGNGFLDALTARFRQSGKRTADASDFCLPEHQGLVHPLARAVELDESSMVDHPVDHRGGKLVVAQDRSPFAELDVGGGYRQ